MLDTDLETTTSTGANDSFNKNEIQIYPNPFRNILYIHSKAVLKSVQVWDIFGRNIISEKNHILTTSALKPGTYIMQIQTSEGVVRSKVLKH